MKSKPSSKSDTTGASRHCSRWTAKEDKELREAVKSGFDVKETAELLGRTLNSIYTRKHQLFSEAGDETRFVATSHSTSPSELVFGEFSEHQQQLVRKELLNSTWDILSKKWSIRKKDLLAYPDRSCTNQQRAIAAIELLGDKQKAADLLGVSTRTIHRYLNGVSKNKVKVEKVKVEKVGDFEPQHDHSSTPVDMNSSVLMVRDVVLALKPYGVSCSFEFEGEQIKTLTATFS